MKVILKFFVKARETRTIDHTLTILKHSILEVHIQNRHIISYFENIWHHKSAIQPTGRRYHNQEKQFKDYFYENEVKPQ